MAKLSPAQIACLEDAKPSLWRWRGGWASGPLRSHQSGTVEALERRGLLRIDRLAGRAGEARITAKGRQALVELPVDE